MLQISQGLVANLLAHARTDHPDEACGVIAGPAGSDRPTRFIPMVNSARSPTFYEFDSTDLLRLYRDMDDRDEVPVVIKAIQTKRRAGRVCTRALTSGETQGLLKGRSQSGIRPLHGNAQSRLCRPLFTQNSGICGFPPQQSSHDNGNHDEVDGTQN